MSFYSILDVTPTTDAWLPDYAAVVTPLVAEHGGKYLARTASHERLEGEAQEGAPDAAVRVLIEWPSREAALAFMNDPVYAPHLKARTEGSTSSHFLVEGKDDAV